MTHETMTPEVMMQEIARLKAENAALVLNAPKAKGQRLNVTAKGCVSFTFTCRKAWPATLYIDQWKEILDNAEQIKAFIGENAARIAAIPVELKKNA